MAKMRNPNIDHHPGYVGAFTRDHAEGAIENGAKVRKAKEDPKGDLTPIGTLGTVLGSINFELYDLAEARSKGVKYLYFVEWDDKPKVAISMVDWKIMRNQ